jgi:hypothetical protein
MQSLLAKFAPALMPMAVLILGGFQAAFADDELTSTEMWQLVALSAGAVVTFIVPLLNGAWAGALKTGANVLAAVAALVIPMLPQFEWSTSAVLFIVVGAIQALSAEIGVGVRLDQAKEVIDSRENPGVPTITTLDPLAVEAVAHDGVH